MVFLGTDLEGHVVVYDSTDGKPRGIGPMRALLTSMGACTGMDIVSILKKRKQKITGLKVLLTGTRPEFGMPKPWKTIDVKYVISGVDIKKELADEAVNDSMAKFCHVAATLRPGVKITYSYELKEAS
jgi:putative redox protein